MAYNYLAESSLVQVAGRRERIRDGKWPYSA